MLYKKSVVFIASLTSFPLASVLANSPLPPVSDRPNIIIVMSDDMGYSDIGCYGSEVQTPTLDGLAAEGLRFTQFYNTGRCCPTRASLLTGLYPHQAGIGWMTNDRKLEGYRGDLNRKSVTIAEALKPAGYSTYCVGKWHVTPHPILGEAVRKHNWPLQRGFDRYYGIINGASSLWDPNSLVRDNELVTIKNDSAYQPAEPYHFTDAISDNAAMYIQKHDTKTPFFMYVAYTAAHWPLHARPKDIAKYEGKYDEGYQPIRKARLARMKELGVVAADAELSPLVGDWDANEDLEMESALMEVYAAMIDQMDQGIGRIVDALKQTGQFDNTLILFLQDNGACQEALEWMDTSSQGPRGAFPSLNPVPDDVIHYDDSQPKQTRDGWPILFGGELPGPVDTYMAYGEAWANVCNTPFREYKHFVHEGGISTPLIAHWPKGISEKNQLRAEPSHLIDLMATCVDLSGAKYPSVLNGENIRPMEGRSLVPVFASQALDREALYWEHEGNQAVRVGDSKLVMKKGRPWELYDISEDRSELHDLSKAKPELVAKMAAMWKDYAVRTHVFPRPEE